MSRLATKYGGTRITDAVMCCYTSADDVTTSDPLGEPNQTIGHRAYGNKQTNTTVTLARFVWCASSARQLVCAVRGTQEPPFVASSSVYIWHSVGAFKSIHRRMVNGLNGSLNSA